MDSVKEKLLQSVNNQDNPNTFLKCLHEDLQNEDALQELIRSLDETQQNELWHGLSGHIISATINEAVNSTQSDVALADNDTVTRANESSLTLLKAALKLAKTTVLLKDCIIPQSLYESALLLHGYVLSSNHNELMEPVAELCEIWWLNKIEGSSSLTLAPLIYHLERCIYTKSTAMSVARLWKLREALDNIAEGNGSMVWDLVLNLFSHNRFLRYKPSHRLLSYVLRTQPSLLKKLHGVMKFKLATSSQVIAEVYADVVLSAWGKCEVAATKAIIETEIIQDIMYNAIHVQRSGPKSLHAQLMQYMSKLYSLKGNTEVSTMLTKLYKPFMWRSLRAANADVRANATQLFLGCFPLIDATQSQEQCETNLQKHFDFLFELLEDEDHVVRQVSVTGVCKMLSVYSSKIPTEVFSDLLDVLFSKLAWDQQSADVRVAVIQGITLLLDDHNNYTMLSALIPSLTDLFHDKVEKVRLTFVKLLLKMKHIRAFKIWKVISKAHLFARLEADSAAVCVLLVQLTYKSFIDDDLDNNVKLERCIELIDSGLERARRFYRYAVVQINVQQAVNYMLLLRKCILTCVSQHKLKGKENRRPSLCTTLANMTMANRTVPLADTTSGIGSNFTMIDQQLTQFSAKDFDGSQEEGEEELSLENISVMKGLFDVLCIMWAGFKKELSMAGNDELNSILCDKFSRALVEFIPVFKDEDIQRCMVYLASFLPVEKSSALRKSTERRLRDFPKTLKSDAAVNTAECSNLILCLCQWGLCDKVVDLLLTWARPLTVANRARRSKDTESSESNLMALACTMNCLLSLHSTIDLMKTQGYLSGLEQVCDKLHYVQVICTKSLSSAQSLGWGADVLTSLLSLHSKFEHILYKDDERRLSSHIKDLCFLVSNCCIQHLGPIDDHQTTHHAGEVKKPRRLLDLQTTVLERSSANESVQSMAADGTSYAGELARETTLTVLIILINHVMVKRLQPETSSHIGSIFRIADTVCATGADLSNALTELLVQLTKSFLMSTSHGDGDDIQDCWSRLISARMHNFSNVDAMTGKNKSSWISLLQSADILSDQMQQAVSRVLVTSMVSLLDDVDITPTLSVFLGATVRTSQALQLCISEELREKATSSSNNELPNENIQVLIGLAEKGVVVVDS